MSEKLIVIGGTAAGLSAASKAKRVCPDMEIEVFERSGYISYGACGLPYFIGGLVEEPEDLVSLTVEQMNQKRGIPTHIHHEVTRINRETKTVNVRDIDTGEESVHSYDKLVIATGARPIRPQMPGVDADGIYYLRTVEDGIRLKHVVWSEKKKRAVIVGGGFIGLEVAEELALSAINGYHGELERTFCIGKPSDEVKRAFSAMVESQMAVLDAIRPGVTSREMDALARRVLKKYGYDQYAIHRCGHGQGLGRHEEPFLIFDSDLVLEENMVFTVEPGIYIPGVGGFRHSDTLILTKNGYENTTDFKRLPEELIFE